MQALGFSSNGHTNIHCPFHNDSNPSFHVYHEDNKFKCFGCGVTGDQFDFIGYHYDLPGSENLYSQVEKFCELFNITREPLNSIDEYKPPAHRPTIDKRTKAYKILNETCELFHNILMEEKNKDILNYVISRFSIAFTKEEAVDLIKKYKIGYCCGNVNINTFNIEDMKSAGFVYVNENSNTNLANDRIIFPYWHKGKIVYANMRKLENSSDPAKYKKLVVNSEQTSYSCIDNVLFYSESITRKKPNSDEINYAVIPEGMIDIYMCLGKDLPFISSATNKFSLAELEKLKKISDNIDVFYIINDNEKSKMGEKGALLTAKELIKWDKDVRIVELPKADNVDKIDLSDYFNTGVSREDFLDLCENSQDYIEFLISKIPNEGKLQNRLLKFKPIISALASTNLPIEPYTDLIQEKIGYKRNEILREIKKFKDSNREISIDIDSELSQCSGFDPFNGSYIVDKDKCFHKRVEINKQIEYKMISSFSGEILREIVCDDGIDIDENSSNFNNFCKRFYEGKFVTKDNTYPFKVAAENFSSSMEFRKLVSNICGTAGNIFPKEDGHCIAAIQSITNAKGTSKKEVIYQHTGWSRDKSIFYCPGFSVDKNFSSLPDLKVDLSFGGNNYSGFKFSKISKEEAFKALNEGVYDGLLKMYEGYSVSAPAIGTVFLPIIDPFLGMNKRYMLWIHGPSGTSKSTFATMLSCFYGEFDNETPAQTWDSTPFFIEKYGFYLKDIMFLIDNYRHKSFLDDRQRNLIHSYADKVSRGRLSNISNMKNSHPIRGFAISTGEDLPSGEASTVARLLPIEVECIASTKKKDYTQEYLPLFRGITPYFIHYLLNKYDMSKFSLSKEFVEIRKEMLNRVMKVLNIKFLSYDDDIFNNEGNEQQNENGVIMNNSSNPVANIIRISINLALNKIGFQFFTDFSSYMGIEQAKINELKEGYEEMLDKLIFKYSKVISEESITSNSVDILSELIASGKFYIDGYNPSGQELSKNATQIGFVSKMDGEEFIMISPKLFCEEVRRINKGSSSSNMELYRQLHKCGYIVPEKSSGELVVATNHKGVRCRMLRFKKSVLFSNRRFTRPDIYGIEQELGRLGKNGYDEDQDMVAPF